MIVKMFKPRFAELVRSGAKKQTVRPKPKRRPTPGVLISCRMWSGRPYQSKQVELCRGVVRSVHDFWFDGVTILIDDPMARKPLMNQEDMEAFARADGFASLSEMADWFKDEHGELPFCGIVIKWEKL